MQKSHTCALGAVALSLGSALLFTRPLVAQPNAADQQRPTRNGHSGNGPEDNGPGAPGGPRHGRPPRLEGPALDDMTQVLQLSAEQQKTIKVILDEAQKQIDAALTPEQRARLQQMRTHHGPPPGPPPEGPPGGPDDRRPPDDRQAPDDRRPPDDRNAPDDRQAQAPQDEDHGRPVAAVARELGVTPEQFRAAFRKVHPAGRGQEPTEAQRQANRKVLSAALGVAPERLDEVMDKYRPGGRGTNGPPRPR